MEIKVVIVQERDGSWTAQIESLGVSTCGATEREARSKAEALALRAIADRIEADQSAPDRIWFAVILGAHLPICS